MCGNLTVFFLVVDDVLFKRSRQFMGIGRAACSWLVEISNCAHLYLRIVSFGDRGHPAGQHHRHSDRCLVDSAIKYVQRVAVRIAFSHRLIPLYGSDWHWNRHRGLVRSNVTLTPHLVLVAGFGCGSFVIELSRPAKQSVSAVHPTQQQRQTDGREGRAMAGTKLESSRK